MPHAGHETRFRQFTREGLASPTYLIESAMRRTGGARQWRRF
jgi:hypothetical protein